MAQGVLINRLPELIKERAINLAALARKADVSYPVMYALARGKTKTVKEDTLEKICKALELESRTTVLEFVPTNRGNGNGSP